MALFKGRFEGRLSTGEEQLGTRYSVKVLENKNILLQLLQNLV
jgi:hypothetical protein